MMRNLKDTYRATHQAVAARILNSSLAGTIGYPQDPNRLLRLQDAAEGKSDLSSWSFLSVEFRKAGTNISLDVKVENEDRYYRGGPTKDKEGNEWEEYKLTCTVNWPCHGSTDVGTSLARIEFYKQAALLAAEIQAEFPELARMTRTAAQVAEAQKVAEEKRLQERVLGIVGDNRRQLRVGGERSLDSDKVQGLVSGRHEVVIVENNGEVKKYVLFVTESVGACLSRVA